MTNNTPGKKGPGLGFWAVMGCIWIGLAVFGSVFDPDKKTIIISQFIVGGLCLIIFVVLKLKKKAL